MSQLTFLSEERPVNRSRLQDSEKEWTMNVATWRLNILGLLNALAPAGWYGKTSPVSCHRTEDGILVPSSGRWSNSGMGGATESLTLSTSEFHNDADVCLLSHILETGDLPQRFYLSAKACQGILRRAEKRGKDLPMMLHRALEGMAQECPEQETVEDKTR